MAKGIDIESMSAATLAGGAVIEALDYELQRAFDNIVDPNTSETGTRVVNLQIKIKPKDRGKAEVSFIAKSVLQPAKAVETEVYIFDQKGKAVASEYVRPEEPKQHPLPTGVTHISAAGGKE